MANGIFGPTGREVMAQIRRDAQLRRAQQTQAMGFDNPFARMAYAGGLQAGEGIGELGSVLTGYKPPEVERAEKRDQAIATVMARRPADTAEQLKYMSQEFSRLGLYQEAYDVDRERRELDLETAEREAVRALVRQRIASAEADIPAEQKLAAEESQFQRRQAQALGIEEMKEAGRMERFQMGLEDTPPKPGKGARAPVRSEINTARARLDTLRAEDDITGGSLTTEVDNPDALANIIASEAKKLAVEKGTNFVDELEQLMDEKVLKARGWIQERAGIQDWLGAKYKVVTGEAGGDEQPAGVPTGWSVTKR